MTIIVTSLLATNDDEISKLILLITTFFQVVLQIRPSFKKLV